MSNVLDDWQDGFQVIQMGDRLVDRQGERLLLQTLTLIRMIEEMQQLWMISKHAGIEDRGDCFAALFEDWNQ